jgi:hypothetical protein
MAKSFTGQEFVKALAEGALRNPVVREGMAKPSEHGVDEIQFSEGRSCLNWTTVPADLIERVEFITEVVCKDHRHPYVRLILKEPESGNRQAGLLAQLLRNSGGQTGASTNEAGDLPDEFSSMAMGRSRTTWVTSEQPRGEPLGRRWRESGITAAQSCPPEGLCEKASRMCRRGNEQPWCDILRRCFACDPDAPPQPDYPCPEGWTWSGGSRACPVCCKYVAPDHRVCQIPPC